MKKHYDIIGDVHGHAAKLIELLEKIGYKRMNGNGYYFHPNRQAIFVGDIIDRGKTNFETLELVKAMVDHGSALITMGNHEYNALCFHTKDKEGNYLRTHGPKNTHLHKEVLEEIEQRGEEEWNVYLEWFRRMPFFLDLDGIRVIHACWDHHGVNFLKNSNIRDSEGRLTDEFLIKSAKEGFEEFDTIELLLKGKEIRLPDDHPGVYDKDGFHRRYLRLKWWIPFDENLKTYDQVVRCDASMIRHVTGVKIPKEVINEIRHSFRKEDENEPHVFFGHYWFSDEIDVTGKNSVCLDYSVGLGGPLVCYQWDGEPFLDASKFVWV